MYDVILNLEALVILILCVYFIVYFTRKYQEQIANQFENSSIGAQSNLVVTFVIGMSIGFGVLYYSWWPKHPLICSALIFSLGTLFLHESFLLALFVLLLFFRPWELLEAKFMSAPLSDLTQNDFKMSDLVSIPKFWFLLLLGNWIMGWHKRIKMHWNYLDCGVLLFLSWVLLPILITSNKEQLNVYLDTMLRSGLIYFLIRCYFQSEIYYEILAKTLGATGIFLLIVTFIQFNYQGGNLAQPSRAEAFGLIRNSNDLAALIVLCIPFTISMFQSRFIHLVVVALSLYAIFLTQSRGAFLGALIAIAAYVIDKKKLKIPSFKNLVLAGLLLILIFKGYTIFLGRADSDIHASTMGRVNYWIAAVRMAIRSPIWGVGFGNYPSQFERYALEFFEYGERTAHSSFFLVLAETGIVGTLLFVFLFKTAFSYLQSFKNKYPELLSAFFGYTVTMLFLSHSYLIFIYIVLALISALKALTHQPEKMGGDFK